MKRYQKIKASQYIVVGLILFGIIGSGLLSTIFMREVPFTDYFAIPWASGRAWLLEAENPYEINVVKLAEDAISNSSYLASLPEDQVFLSPLPGLIFYLPFSLIPYGISRVLWTTLLVICIILISYFSFILSNWNPSRLGIIIILLCSLLWVPGIVTILTGRLSPILIFLILVSLYLLVKGEDTTAGFVLALTSGSFTISGLIILLILIYGLLKRRWSIISAYLSGFIFMLIVSYLLLPSWPRSWLRLLLDNYSNMELIQTPIMRLAALLPGIENPLSIFLHALLGIFFIFLLFSLRGKSNRLFIWDAFATFVISYLVNIQGSIDSLFILYPAFFLVFRFLNERWGLFGRIFSWTTIVIFSTIPWLMILPVESFKDPVGLPLLSIVLPLLALIGINWIRWWALNIPRLPFESL